MVIIASLRNKRGRPCLMEGVLDAGTTSDMWTKTLILHPTMIVLQQGDSGFSSDAVITATYNTGTAKLRFEVRDALDINGSGTATESESVSGYAPSDLIVLNNNTVVAAAEVRADWSDTFGGEINVLKVTETGGTRPYALEITNSSPLPAGAFQVDLVVNESGGFHAVWVIDANYATTSYAPGLNHTTDMDKTVQFAEFDKFGNISWEGVPQPKNRPTYKPAKSEVFGRWQTEHHLPVYG